jgi:hypothetical protein
MALRSTRPLTYMSTRDLPGGKGRPERKADSPTAICELIVYKMWEPRRLTTLLASTTCYRAALPLQLMDPEVAGITQHITYLLMELSAS